MGNRLAWAGGALALAALASGCWHSARPAADAGDDATTVPADGGQACSGAVVDKRCRTELAMGEVLPYNLVANSTHLYWTTSAPLPGAPGSLGTVMRIALAGGSPEKLADGVNPHTIVLDDSFVYWTDFLPATGDIVKMPLDGGAPVVVVDGQDNPHGLAVDQSSVYWTNFDGRQIGKADKQPPSGGTSTPTYLAEGRMSPNNLAVDDTFVYWTEWIANGAIMRARIDGSSPTPLVPFVSGQNQPYGVVLDRTNIYWTNSAGGQVMKMPLDGSGAPVALAQGQDQPFGLAVDDTNVYFANYRIVDLIHYVGQVRSVPIAGGAVTDLAAATSFAVAIDATSVYWTTYESAALDGSAIEGGSVFRLTPK